MLNLGFSELALIVVVAFVIFGPAELPNIIRSLSKFMRQCRAVIDDCAEQLGGDEVKQLTSEVAEQKRYIRDQFGELREVYDVSDILEQRKIREDT